MPIMKPLLTAGSNRIILLPHSHYVIKIPNFLSGWRNMIMGFMENMSERYWLVSDHTLFIDANFNKNLAPIVFADCFGFCVIMKKVTPITEVLNQYDTKEEIPQKYHNNLNTLWEWCDGMPFRPDFNEHNLGIDEQDNIVFLDYGYVTSGRYIGTPTLLIRDKNGMDKKTLRGKLFFTPMRWLSNKIWKLLTVLGIYQDVEEYPKWKILDGKIYAQH